MGAASACPTRGNQSNLGAEFNDRNDVGTVVTNAVEAGRHGGRKMRRSEASVAVCRPQLVDGISRMPLFFCSGLPTTRTATRAKAYRDEAAFSGLRNSAVGATVTRRFD